MKIEQAHQIMGDTHATLLHLTEHFSAIVAGIAESRVAIRAVVDSGFYAAELAPILSVLEGSSSGTKAAGDGVSVARHRLKQAIGPSDGIASFGTD